MKKIAIIGLKRLGDAIYTLPIFNAYSEQKNFILDVFTIDAVKDIYTGNPFISKIHSFSKETFWKSCLKNLKEQNYDECIVLHNGFKYALLPFLAKIPVRVGFKKELRSVLLTKSRRLPRETVHSLEHNALIMDLVNVNTREIVPKIYLTKTDEIGLEKVFKRYKLEKKSYICFIVGSVAKSRRWFPKCFAETIKIITNRHNLECIILGGQDDVTIADDVMSKIKNKTQVKNLTGKTSLRETIGLFNHSLAVITNDTGPLHIAATLDCKVITWVGITTKLAVIPNLPNVKVLNSKVPCEDCLKTSNSIKGIGCLHKITPERVVKELESFFDSILN